VRLDALVVPSAAGLFYVDGEEVPLEAGDAVVFRPDVERHQLTPVERNARVTLSAGAHVDIEAARKAGLA
jgi:predicted 2-oxoglutarate/Fe(II)-dependent dioxygenase YbiX